jgi:pimeloyl-ACP methyl ester carboxylesterase
VLLREYEVFCRYRPRDHGTALVLLHGFPGSSFDWRHLVERLPELPFVALDFLGFGFSAKPKVPNDLHLQADLVEDLLESLAVERARIVAHDMGTSVATELFAREIDGRLGFECDAALLFNGSMVERGSPTWEQKVLRSRFGFLLSAVANQWSFRRGLGAVFSPAHPLTRDEAQCQWALMCQRRGQRALHRAITYIDQRVRFARRWHQAICEWPGRLELAWGLRDPVATPAVLAALRELRPGVPVHELPDLGHYPQIEDPVRMAEIVSHFSDVRDLS